MAEAQIAALTAQVEKEKNTAKENLQKAIKASREKKVVETELQQVKAQLLQAQQAAGAAGAAALTTEVNTLRAALQEAQGKLEEQATKIEELEAELEEAQETAESWQDEAEASASQLTAARQQLAANAAGAVPLGGNSLVVEEELRSLRAQLAQAAALRQMEAAEREGLMATNARLLREKSELEEEVAYITEELENAGGGNGERAAAAPAPAPAPSISTMMPAMMPAMLPAGLPAEMGGGMMGMGGGMMGGGDLEALLGMGGMGMPAPMPMPSMGSGIDKEAVNAESRRLGQRVHQLFGEGKYPQALDIAEQQMRLLKESFGDGHHEYATAMNNVATLHQALGHYSQAEPLLLEASKIQERTLGCDHPHTVASLSNLATVYEAMGEKERAASMQALVKMHKLSWEKKQSNPKKR